VDADRDAHNKETLLFRRHGLPPRNRAKKAATHVDALSGSFLIATQQENLFGSIGQAVAAGDSMRIECEGEAPREVTVVESVQVGPSPGYYIVAVA